VYSQLDGLVRFIKPDGSYRMDAAGRPLSVPGFNPDVATQYPRSASVVMLGLRPDSLNTTGSRRAGPAANGTTLAANASSAGGGVAITGGYSSVEILVVGGVPADNPCVHGEPDNLQPAVRTSQRLRLSWTMGAGTGA
jgi:hypothetical protein